MFCEHIIQGVQNNTLDVARGFFADESLFKNGKDVQNRQNDYVIVKKKMKKKDLPDDMVVSHVTS